MSSEYRSHYHRDQYDSPRGDRHHNYSSSGNGRRRSRSPPTGQRLTDREYKSARSLPQEGSDRRREGTNKPYERRRERRADFRPPRGQMSQEEEKQLREWVAGEDVFALQQAKKGAMIRVKEGRARPVDWLAMNLRILEEDNDLYDGDLVDGVEFEIPVPYTVIEGLNLAEIQKLESDIANYLKLEKLVSNFEFWEATMILCKDIIEKLRTSGKAQESAVLAVSEDIDNILGDKDYDELVGLEDRIEVLLSGDSAVDVEFWSQLKKELLIRKAKAKLKRVHDLAIRDRVKLLNRMQKMDAQQAISQIQSSTLDSSQLLQESIPYAPVMDEVSEHHGEKIGSHVFRDTTTSEEFLSRLTEEQQKIERIGFVPRNKPRSRRQGSEYKKTAGTDFESGPSDRLFEKEAAQETNDNEEVFDDEEDLDAAGEMKEKLKKPKYFNRVQMGFDWNKYNQTHYNQDNPPPKVVQGYKFNIFYPELIDSARAPTYKIVREGGRRRGQSYAGPGESDTCVIKFIAGPPYQDLAFRIVDREWDYSSRRENGFKSSFDRGILQLHFRFKKIFYRK
ncbi:cactus-binding C-terminus of cactin protein-domain-containing protein [Lipomyces tetrasporus]|uniref:Splicing factor Cactin n=1 Tax=Lipomyces tetrasporus TaxID=54092 RepID=A0AAD7QKG3_9ASCO|nr:cactus-binding C-terminus of cactin protein-domain-containing protein [Lipomyces tetrasporus]KAJ8096719.1 cactus-binding C-terminus of cactin protein-domain-containing protein [Lipomyces tetrasporus]